ncbi:hypothetical protein PFISCL1PPCAC_27822, partial [Pristionchus fissidentatus]
RSLQFNKPGTSQDDIAMEKEEKEKKCFLEDLREEVHVTTAVQPAKGVPNYSNLEAGPSQQLHNTVNNSTISPELRGDIMRSNLRHVNRLHDRLSTYRRRNVLNGSWEVIPTVRKVGAPKFPVKKVEKPTPRTTNAQLSNYEDQPRPKYRVVRASSDAKPTRFVVARPNILQKRQPTS